MSIDKKSELCVRRRRVVDCDYDMLLTLTYMLEKTMPVELW
jgi:hypothetical protein